MENKDLQVRTFLNANGTPFYPKTRWSAIVDAPDIEGIVNNVLEEGNYVSDANYVHTDNNFTNAIKTRLDDVNLYLLSVCYRDNAFEFAPSGMPDYMTIRRIALSYSNSVIPGMAKATMLLIKVMFYDLNVNYTRIFSLKDVGEANNFNSDKIIFNNVDFNTKTEHLITIDRSGWTYNAQPLSINISELQNVSISNPSNGDVLKYNGSNWIAGTVDSLPSQSGQNGKFLTTNGTTASWATVSAGSSSLSELTDVTLGTLSNGDVLKYDTQTSKWINGTVPAGRERFQCTFSAKEDSGESGYIITCDKTVTEIAAAVNADKEIDAVLQLYFTESEYINCVCPFVEYVEGMYIFNGFAFAGLGYANFMLGAGMDDNQDFFSFELLFDTNDISTIRRLADVATSGDYEDLINKPTIPSGTVTSVGVSVPTGLSVSGTPVTSSGTIAISLASGYSIPTTTKQSEWDAKQSAIDSTNKLSADYIEDGTTNKVINVKPDWNAASGADAEILNKPSIPAAQVNSDWNAVSGVAEILNKPAIHNIPAGGNAGQVLKKTSATDYDVNWANASETLPSAYCTTSGSTAAKKANCSLYVTQANQYLQVLIGSANTYQGALTLNINSAGDKPIYINGTVSSSSNYTLPNGTYFVFYDGTNYYFRTDGKLPMKDAAFGGSYNDLANKPTIPDAVSGTDDGTNWTSITIGSNTKAIPSGGGGSSTLSGLTDTSITTPANGEVLKYNSTSSKWENSNEIQADYQQMNNTAADYIKNAPLVRIYRSVTGTAAVTTPAESYTGAKYDVTDNTITSYVDGMVVCIKVPVVGNGSYGTGLQINSLGYKPIVYNVNTMITNRYSVGSVIWAVYNDSQGAVFYDAGTKYTVTGCWQVMDYNADTTAPYNLTRYNGTRLVSANLYRYVLLLRKDLTTLIPIHSVVGTSPAATTATTKTMTTESFDPFGEIYYYPTSEEVTAGNAVAMSALYTQKSAVDGRYIFNSGKTLTANKEIYLVMDLQSDGKVKLASTAWSQTLPSTNDGHLYKLLGYTYDSYRFELYNYHPIYYYDGTQLRQYTGAAIPDAVSGTNDGTNWTTLTIGSVTKNIPSGGGGSSTLTGLTDTNISSPSDGQMLKYDNSSSKWVNANVPTELPSVTGNASKILAVNSGATGVEWITNSGGGGLTNYDFTHIANTTVSTSTTITFAANTRGSQMVSTAADLAVTFAVNNLSDNYLWIKNTGSADIDITINSVTHDSSSVSNVYVPDDGITISAGKVCEIGIVVNADGAFITSRSDLSL